MLKVQSAKGGGRATDHLRALEQAQAEITAADAYAFSDGKAIFGSGTRFPEVVVDARCASRGR